MSGQYKNGNDLTHGAGKHQDVLMCERLKFVGSEHTYSTVESNPE